MSIYDVSAAERRRRAQEMAQMKAMARTPYTGEAKEEEDKNVWATVGDFFGNIFKGAVKGLEGIYDFGATIVGEVGGWFDDDFKNDVREHIEYDATGAITDPWLNDLQKQSYLGEDSMVRDVANAVGNMLPSVALSIVPGGAPFATATFMGSAAGQGTEEAMKSGAGYESSMAYGIGSGLVEGATEKLGGFVLGDSTSLIGKRIAGTKLGKATSKGLGKFAMNAASEGVEELITDVGIDPGLKYITGVDKNVGENYLNAVQNAPRTFGTGAVAGSAMHGGQTLGRNVVNKLKGRGGAKATRADNAVANIIEISKNYNESRDNNFKLDAAIRQNLSTISQELVKMTPEARKNYLESVGAVEVEGEKPSFLKGAFNENGTLSEGYFTWFRNAGTNAPKNQYYSHGVAGKRSAVQSDMEKITRELRDSYARNKGVSFEEAERAVSDVKIYEGELSAKEQKEFSKFKEGFTALNQISGDGLSFVMIESNSEINGTIVDGKTVYIGKDNFENGQWAKTLVHEYTHFAEGTPEYESLLRILVRNGDFANKVDKAMSQMGYGFDYDRILEIEKKQAENKELTAEDKAYYEVYKTELMAHMSEELLGNEKFIEKLVVQNKSLAAKVLHKIKNLLSSLGNIKNDNARAQHRFLKTAENLYLNAIHRAGYKYVNGRIVEDEEKEKHQEADGASTNPTKENVSNVRYSKKSFSQQVDDILKGQDTMSTHLLVMKTPKLLQDAGLPNLPILMTAGHLKSIVAPKNKANSHDHGLDLTIVKKLPEYISDPVVVADSNSRSDSIVVITEAVDFNNNPVIAAIKLEGHGAVDSKYIDANIMTSAYGKDNFQNFINKLAKNNAIIYWNNKKSQAMSVNLGVQFPNIMTQLDSNTIIRKAGAFVNRKFSDVTESQQFKRFFGDWQNKPQSASKVVNDDGTPKVVYHGTNAKFTVFDYDKTKLGKLGYGFYFTANKNFAKNYAVGDNLVEAYIDIKNPLIIEETVLTEKQIDSMLEKLSEFELKADGKNIQELKEELMSQETEISRNFLFLKIASKYQDVLDNMGDVIGFDGIIDKNWDEYVVFSSNQIKSATDNIGTFDRDDPDIRYSRKRAYDPKNGQDITFEAVEGGVKVNFNDFEPHKSNDNSNDFEAAERARQESLDALLEGKEAPRRSPVSHDNNLLRQVVNNTKAKKYTRKEIKTIVDELLSQEGYFGDNTVVMKGKKRAELEKMLWQALNTKGEGELGGAALDAAEYLIQNAIAIEYLEVTDDIQLAVQFVDALKPYLHNMNLDFIKGDIKAKLDKDKTPYLMWAVKKDSSFRGYTADEVAQELETLGFKIEKTNEADIFLEINELYRLAKQTITDAVPAKDTLLNALGTKEAKKLKQKLVKDILIAKDEKGTETSFYKLQQKYIKQIAELGEKVKTAHRRNTLENRILKEAKRIVDSNKHTFANATEIQTDALKNIKKLLSRVNSREQVNRSTLRAIMKELAIWYSEKNPVLQGFYDNYIAEHLAYFAETIGDNADVRDAEGIVPYEVVQKMDSVKTVTGEEFAKGETDLVTQVENYFKSLGSKVTNEELGEVLIDKRGIKDDIAHGIGRKKAATFAAVPDVIQKGKVVDYQKNWKGRNYDTAVIAAPITVGSEKHYMGVVVIQNKENNRFYVHEVVEIKKEGAQPFKTGPVEKNSNTGGDAPSVISILQKIAIYNRESENSQNVKREKPLSIGELEMVQVILHHMNHVFENFGKMWRGGKYVEASDVASAQYDKLKEAEANHSSFEKAILHNKALRYIMDPMAVLAAWDGHDPDGYFTTTYKEFAEGLIGQRWDEMQALAEFDEFRKKHKKYFKALVNGKDMVKVSGRIDPRNLTVSEIEIPKNVAIDLYMVSKTGQAIVTLEEVGYKVRIDGQHEQETMQTVTKGQIEEMYNKFSQEDKELISIMERAYNGYCRDLKYNTDMKRLGFSNVFEGYYYPINRIGATDFDTDNFFQMMERVSNISANKSRVKGAKNAIITSNALTKFMRHVNAVARYANLAIPVENMNRVFNLDISGDKHMPTSIKMKLSENALWKGAEDYMKRLTDDVQQIGVKPDGGSKTISWLRGNYAKFQLGANPKVWFTQLSSYFASFGELRASSLAKAVAVDGSDVDKYCRLAAIRHYDKAATKAQSLTDKTGNALTVPIETVDRGVIRKLFAACQAEAQARYKLEIGTEENKIKAGEILTEVILKTQQNQLITEQSAAMRSTSEIIKSFTMFSADSMKLLSRFVQYMGEVATLNKRIKAANAKGDTALAEQLTAQRNKAVKSLIKSSVSILSVAVWMAALAKLFKLLYNKDDEEETVAEWLGEGALDNIIGMVPFVRDAYSYFADGYDTDIFVTSMANDVLKSLSKTRDIFTAWVSGENVTSEQFYSNIRSLAYSFGQILGLPTRNVYNFTTGIIRRIDEGTGKSIDAWFKEPSESDAKESIREGIEDRDESLTEYGLNQMYKKYEIEASDKALKSEFDRLLKLNATKDEDDNTDYSPLGFKIPENLEIDGEDVELSAEDRKVFKNGLKSAEKSSAAMVKTYYYKQLSDKYKAYAIRKVYEYYDLMSREELGAVSEERARLLYYGEAVGIDMLAVLLAYKQ